MSLVEKALERLQQTKGQSPVRTAAKDAPDLQATGVRPALDAHRVPRKTVHFDRPALRAAGLLPPEHQERQIADEYRQIKRPLVEALRKTGADAIGNANLIMVSSALPGDGKTFTSLNLAMSLARERDFNVLLVDADVAKPHISTLFGVDGEPGLLDALRNESMDVETLIVDTDLQGLSILPAGRRSETATELLASKRMRSVVDQLPGRGGQRIIVIDSPPLMLTSEARVLASTAGQVVLVVRSGKTPQQSLLEVLNYLDPERQAIGLVLNQSLTSAAGYYRYGYGDQVHESRAES